MLSKTKVLDAIKKLPDQFSMDELVEKLILIEKIERGLQEVNAGKTVDMDQAKQRMAKWLK